MKLGLGNGNTSLRENQGCYDIVENPDDPIHSTYACLDRHLSNMETYAPSLKEKSGEINLANGSNSLPKIVISMRQKTLLDGQHAEQALQKPTKRF